MRIINDHNPAHMTLPFITDQSVSHTSDTVFVLVSTHFAGTTSISMKVSVQKSLYTDQCCRWAWYLHCEKNPFEHVRRHEIVGTVVHLYKFNTVPAHSCVTVVKENAILLVYRMKIQWSFVGSLDIPNC